MAKALIEYLPVGLRGVREYIHLFSALSPEALLIQDEIDRAFNNQFIKTAYEDGVAQLEKLYDIRNKASDSLDVRKFRLLTRSIGMLPVTEKNLTAMLEILCGRDGFEIYSEYENYYLKIRVALEKKSSFLDVSELCRNAIPANILLDLSLMYNQNSTISSYKHSYMSGFSHKEIKEMRDD